MKATWERKEDRQKCKSIDRMFTLYFLEYVSNTKQPITFSVHSRMSGQVQGCFCCSLHVNLIDLPQITTRRLSSTGFYNICAISVLNTRCQCHITQCHKCTRKFTNHNYSLMAFVIVEDVQRPLLNMPKVKILYKSHWNTIRTFIFLSPDLDRHSGREYKHNDHCLGHGY